MLCGLRHAALASPRRSQRSPLRVNAIADTIHATKTYLLAQVLQVRLLAGLPMPCARRMLKFRDFDALKEYRECACKILAAQPIRNLTV